MGFPAKRSANPANQSGQSVVELLVVTVIVAIIAVAGVFSFARASRLEQNLRREAFVRTRLVRHLELIERGLSLGARLSEGGGGEVFDSSESSKNAGFSVSFPMETGGISLESNRYFRVSRTSLEWTPYAVLGNIDYEGGSETNGTKKMEPDPIPIDFSGSSRRGAPTQFARFTGLSVTNFGGALLKVRLSADVAWQSGQGEWTYKPVSAERIVRLWNR